MISNKWIIISIILILINIMAYISMGVDKKRAIKGKYRISEKTFFTLALLGGSLGCILGMKHFRHKTKHWYFRYGMPLILVVQLILVGIVILKPIFL